MFKRPKKSKKEIFSSSKPFLPTKFLHCLPTTANRSNQGGGGDNKANFNLLFKMKLNDRDFFRFFLSFFSIISSKRNGNVE